MRYEDFARRAGRRLELIADRLELEAERPGIDDELSRITARAQELRVAALLVREEAVAVGREEGETYQGGDLREPARQSARLGASEC